MQITKAILNPCNWLKLGAALLLIAVVSCMPDLSPAAEEKLLEDVQK